MELKAYLRQRQALINRALGSYLPLSREYPGKIHQAMRYSVLGQGKRIRPVLTLAACEAVGGRPTAALPAACALELIHAYSLVHDDLPSMDDDDFRRGKPSTHKRFGEAIGVLTGDALLTFGFELLSHAPVEPTTTLKVIQEIARAIGTQGMIGGQVADVLSTRNGNGKLRPKTLEYIHTRKTGALLGASVRVGALLGKADSQQFRCLSRFGDRIGLVFQWVDDLLDGDGAVKLYGRKAVSQKAEHLTLMSLSDLTPLGPRAEPLRALAHFILRRGC